jgi:dihydroorotate dehydrogenase
MCDGICISNTIPWAALPSVGINRRALFGTDESPLERYGGGGLSGAPLLPLVAHWVYRARCVGITKHINAGGGILHPDNLDNLKTLGADSVSLGSIAILRPWRLQATIRRAHQLFN